MTRAELVTRGVPAPPAPNTPGLIFYDASPNRIVASWYTPDRSLNLPGTNNGLTRMYARTYIHTPRRARASAPGPPDGVYPTLYSISRTR